MANVKSPDNKDFWIIDEEAAGVVRLIFRLFLDGKKPQPNRRISDAGANPNAHILHEKSAGGERAKTGRSMRITVTSGTKPLDPYPYTAGVLRRCSQLQDYKAFPGQAEPLCRPEPMADNRKCA